MARADALSYLAARVRKLAEGDKLNGRTEHHQIARELDRLSSSTNDYVATLERDLKIAEDEWKRQIINCQALKSALLDLNSNAHSPTFVIRRTDEALDKISSTELSSEPKNMKRRGFLQWLAGGAAILTTTQVRLIEKQLGALPGDGLTPDWTVLNWRSHIEPGGHILPSDCEWGDAVYVESSDAAMVYVGDGVGWVMLTAMRS